MNWKDLRSSKLENHSGDGSSCLDGITAVEPEEVRRGLEAIGLSPREPREIRILKTGANLSGVFDSAELAAEAIYLEASYRETRGCYITLNPSGLAITNELSPGPATSDGDIIRRTCLVVDVDPVRRGAKQTAPATNTEKLAARGRATTVATWLRQEGWPEPSWVDTPNGVQLWWKINLPAEDGLVKAVLKYLQQVWPEKTVDPASGELVSTAKIDTTLSNASRIVRVPGTPGRKGDGPTEERPWRCGGTWTGPTMEEAQVLDTDLLVAMAMQLGASTGPVGYDPSPADSEAVQASTTWLTDWLQIYKVPNMKPIQNWKHGGKIIELRRCPWQKEHGESYRPFVGVLPSGKLTAGCHGERCEGKKWHHFRALYENLLDTAVWDETGESTTWVEETTSPTWQLTENEVKTMNVRTQQYLDTIQGRIDYLTRILENWDGRKDPSWYIKELDALKWAIQQLNEMNETRRLRNDGTLPTTSLS